MEGSTRLPTAVSQEHLIGPFPAIPPPDKNFKLSVYTAISFP